MRQLCCAVLVFTVTSCVVRDGPNPNDPCLNNPCHEANRNLCVNEDGNPRCLCNAGYVARPSGFCEEIGAQNCPEHSGDSAEPDDCQSRAKPIKTSDGPKNQSIEPLGDYDFFTFDAVLNNVYIATVTSSGALLPRIDLFDQGGVLLATGEGSGEAQLSAKAPSTSKHFIRVMHSPVDPSVAIGNYVISLTTTGPEDHGDGPSDATTVVADVAQPFTNVNGRFEFPLDQDWFSFTGTSTQNYTLAFDPNRGIPAVALFCGGNTTTPLWTAQQPTIPFDLQPSSAGTCYFALYLAPGQSTVSYTFQFTRMNK